MPQYLACSLQTDSFYPASVCSLPEGDEEEQQRGGRREGWENKASIVVSPAGPGRAALAGASYVMWLAGPTSLFRAATHTNPYWGTSPAQEETEKTDREQRGNQWRKCDYKNLSLSSVLNTQAPPLTTLLLKDKTLNHISMWWWLQLQHWV